MQASAAALWLASLCKLTLTSAQSIPLAEPQLNIIDSVNLLSLIQVTGFDNVSSRSVQTAVDFERSN